MRFLLPLLVLAAPFCTGGTITSGSVTYTIGTLPTSQTGTGPVVDWKISGPASPDQLVSNWWYYRVGNERERPFGNYNKTPANNGSVTTTETYSGNTATFTIRETSNSAGTVRFNAVLAYTLTSGPNGSWSLLETSLQISNPNSTPLTMTLFNYLNADIQGTATNDTATRPATNQIRITDPTGFVMLHTATTAPTSYQVAAASTLLNSLTNNSATNLNNTGLPFGPGNYTGAYQWNVTVPANGTFTIFSSIRTSDPNIHTPEPDSWILMLAGAAAIFLGRAKWIRKRL